MIIGANLELNHNEEYFIHMLINDRGFGGFTSHKEESNNNI
jgi:hypothetical protein